MHTVPSITKANYCPYPARHGELLRDRFLRGCMSFTAATCGGASGQSIYLSERRLITCWIAPRRAVCIPARKIRARNLLIFKWRKFASELLRDKFNEQLQGTLEFRPRRSGRLLTALNGSYERKAASAQIAKIPYPLARYIARAMRPTPI